MSNKVQWFSHENLGAPQLTNTWGCLIDVLDACLVSGFGSQVVSSLVVQHGVATVDFGMNHKINQFQWVEISGASDSALNGQFKVLGVGGNTIDFVVEAQDQTATGTIACKIAPLGWSKVFEGAQKGVYQASDTIENPYFLRVDNSRDPLYSNSYAKFAKVGFFDTCYGIDDFSGNQVPYDLSNPTRNWIGTGSGDNVRAGWFKWHYARGSNNLDYAAPENNYNTIPDGERPWFLVGDGSSFYICLGWFPKTNTSAQHIVIPHGFSVCKKRNVTTACLFANEGGSAAESRFASNALIDSLYNNILMMHNVKNSLVNTGRGIVFASPSQYSGYSGAVIRDTDDGDVFFDILLKDQSGHLAGTLNIAKYVLHDSGGDPLMKLVTSDGRAYLLIRTVITNNNFGSAFLKTAIAFDLGDL